MELSCRARIAAAALTAVTAATCLTLVAACGSQAAPRLATTAYAVSHGGPPHGSRAASLALGRKMVGQVRRPPGSRAIRAPRRLPWYLRAPAQGIGAIHRVDVARFYTSGRSMRASYAYLKRHVPRGYVLQGSGYLGQGSRPVLDFVTYSPKSVPRWVDTATLVVGVARGRHGRSVLRADGEVAWFPPRSAAEHLRPAAYRAVTITRMSPAGHSVTRTFRARSAIARLARILNSLPASAGGSVSCQPVASTYRLVFRPRAGHPRFAVTAFDCYQDGTDQVTVAGRAQPALADAGNRVAAAARRLLHRQPH